MCLPLPKRVRALALLQGVEASKDSHRKAADIRQQVRCICHYCQAGTPQRWPVSMWPALPHLLVISGVGVFLLLLMRWAGIKHPDNAEQKR